jgi:GT2 family glycosyltransferase
VATRDHRWARLVPSPANVGFARGANAGAAAARGDMLVFLNPDATVEPGAIGVLVQALETMPAAGIAGGGLADEDGAWQPGAARFAVLPHLLDDDRPTGATPRRGARRRLLYGTFMAVGRDAFQALGAPTRLLPHRRGPGPLPSRAREAAHDPRSARAPVTVET